MSSADSSLHRRASERARASSPTCTPGVEIEVMATLMPASSMKDSIRSASQGGGAMPPTGWAASLVSRKKKSGRMWWWTSMTRVMTLAAEDQLAGLAGDHEGRGVGPWAGDDLRHHRGVRHPQPLEAAHAQLRIDDRHLVDA